MLQHEVLLLARDKFYPQTISLQGMACVNQVEWGMQRAEVSMPEGAKRCAACAVGVAAGLENSWLACVAVVEVGVPTSGACNMT